MSQSADLQITFIARIIAHAFVQRIQCTVYHRTSWPTYNDAPCRKICEIDPYVLGGAN